MLLQGVRAVVFDAVGTLLHPCPPAVEVYAQVGRRFGSRLTSAEIASRFRRALDHEERVDQAAAQQTSEGREWQRWRQIVASVFTDVANGDACFQELYEHFGRPTAWGCEPDTAATLEVLAQRGYALGLASNYDHRLRLVAAGLAELKPLQHLIISSEVGWRKPAPQFFTAVCHSLQLPANQILFLGDDLVNDYEGARAAGLQAVLFSRAKQSDLSSSVQIAQLAILTAGLEEVEPASD
jgi:putative hydrolase of the HAD superfamily